MRWAKPRFSSPSRLVRGTRTPSKASSDVSCALRPTFSRLRPRENPSRSASTSTRLVPCAPPAGSVLATTTIRSADWPLVMKVLRPSTTRWLPSARAVVRIPCKSLPAPGSVMATAAMAAPEASLGSHSRFWSPEP